MGQRGGDKRGEGTGGRRGGAGQQKGKIRGKRGARKGQAEGWKGAQRDTPNCCGSSFRSRCLPWLGILALSSFSQARSLTPSEELCVFSSCGCWMPRCWVRGLESCGHQQHVKRPKLACFTNQFISLLLQDSMLQA